MPVKPTKPKSKAVRGSSVKKFAKSALLGGSPTGTLAPDLVNQAWQQTAPQRKAGLARMKKQRAEYLKRKKARTASAGTTTMPRSLASTFAKPTPGLKPKPKAVAAKPKPKAKPKPTVTARKKAASSTTKPRKKTTTNMRLHMAKRKQRQW